MGSRRAERFFLSFLPGLLFVVSLISAGLWSGIRAQAAENPVQERMRKDIVFLASDGCEGRGITTNGINLAADYIAAEFKAAGLKPANADRGFFQPFTINGPGKLDRPNALQLKGPAGQIMDLEIDKQFQVLGLSG